jgi:DNA-binding NarL/FixJ family response regulator
MTQEHEVAGRDGRPTIDVLLVDDHEVITVGLALLVDGEPDMRCVARAHDGAEAIRRVHDTRPDVVVMDVSMPRLDGISAAARIRQQAPEVKVVMLTATSDRAVVRAAYDAGAAAYLLKDAAPYRILDAIRSVTTGEFPEDSLTMH